MVYINKYYWDLVVSVLYTSDIEAHKKFLAEQIGINEISKIELEFNVKNIEKNKNPIASEVLKILNPASESKCEITVEKFNSIRKIDLTHYDNDLFFILAVLILYKDYKIITSFKVIYNENMTVKNLSEGEKKLLLIYSAINLFDGNENLILLDEPDAHLHEGRKKKVCDLILEDNKCQIIATSHSPTLTNYFNVDNLVVLTINKGKKVDIISEDKKKTINRLTDGIWCSEAQCILLESKANLLLVEGKGDTKYIKKAIKYFKEKDDKYKAIDFFVLPFGGAGNCKDFINNIIDAGIVNRKIIVLFDADGEGKKKLGELINKKIKKYTSKIYSINDFTKCLLSPKESANNNEEFMVEDYFDLSGYEEERNNRYSKCNGVKRKSEFRYSDILPLKWTEKE